MYTHTTAEYTLAPHSSCQSAATLFSMKPHPQTHQRNVRISPGLLLSGLSRFPLCVQLHRGLEPVAGREQLCSPAVALERASSQVAAAASSPSQAARSPPFKSNQKHPCPQKQLTQNPPKYAASSFGAVRIVTGHCSGFYTQILKPSHYHN